ncbi:hypothetical protein EPUL_002869, partial [Erysiphe pulchra]
MTQFIDLCIILALFLFLAPTSPTAPERILPEQTLPEQTSPSENGYDCGKFFFTDQMIAVAIQEAFSEEGRKLVMPYIGRLYSHTMSLYTWPLKYSRVNRNTKKPTIKIWIGSVYQVVFTEYGEAIDMIVRIANNDFAKCWRIENSQPVAQPYELEQSNGYQCGQRFIPTEDLTYSRDIAMTFIGKEKEFPATYIGHLYNPDAGFLIWPIYRGRAFYRYANGPRGPYYLVMNSIGQIQDVIVKTEKQNSYVRCIRSRNDLSPPYVDAESSTAAQTVISGFMCKDVFFSDDDLNIARNLALKSRSNFYPKMYNGPPFYFPCYLWPVRSFSLPYGPGNAPLYRLVLTLDYQIVVSKDDKHDYRCGDQEFKNHELLATAKVACQRKKDYDNVYPQSYKGYVFEVGGPYMIYPLIKGKMFTHVAGRNFVHLPHAHHHRDGDVAVVSMPDEFETVLAIFKSSNAQLTLGYVHARLLEKETSMQAPIEQLKALNIAKGRQAYHDKIDPSTCHGCWKKLCILELGHCKVECKEFAGTNEGRDWRKSYWGSKVVKRYKERKKERDVISDEKKREGQAKVAKTWRYTARVDSSENEASFFPYIQSCTPEQTLPSGNGYDCGKYFFTDEMIMIAIQEAFSDAGRELVNPYLGPLHDQTMNLYTWPLKYDRVNGGKRIKQPSIAIWIASVYQVVFTEYGEAVDVIVRIANSDFAKCWRIENFQPIAQMYELEQSTGYQCGQKFIPNEDISYSRDIAITFIGKGRQFPVAYTGHLYNPDAGFLIWPIYRGREFYRYGIGPKGPYYIVIDIEGRVQDVIVKTEKQNSYVRCIRSRNDLSPPYVDAESSTIVGSSTAAQNVISGFTCEHTFFSNNDLVIAKNIALKSRSNLWPKLYNGPPFGSPCYLWPLRAFSTPYGPGKAPSYRLVLSLEYEIMCVVMEAPKKLIACERKTITSRVSNNDEYDYRCGFRIFTKNELLATAKIACERKKQYMSVFPRLYEEHVFDVEGPYQIYPLKKDKMHKR